MRDDMAALMAQERCTADDLRRIVEVLRGPGGCPWDAVQTHESIRKNFIEETYEVIEAINKRDDALLCEELGDVLLQVVMHAQMAQTFGWDEVTDGICRKLIERHPHVFGDVQVSGAGEVLSNWDAIKRRSKGQRTSGEAMDSVPRELPALMRAAKIQQKAAKAGFDWDEANGVRESLAKLEEEVAELRRAWMDGDPSAWADELGDVLFSAVNASRFLHCDAEEALTAATDKFRRRFGRVEVLAAAAGLDMAKTPLSALDRLWEQAKAEEGCVGDSVAEISAV
ncbi:MAG: nucleoside triphosphate pyrophosphohydrolase [Oscillospiraceae bacterium]|jgi:tetrapyrrole methylase family protein/MazG family protein|nr:nucleoside triphosphate pyrophosphohydrolase [Oscillospiraceae bacterium]